MNKSGSGPEIGTGTGFRSSRVTGHG